MTTTKTLMTLAHNQELTLIVTELPLDLIIILSLILVSH